MCKIKPQQITQIILSIKTPVKRLQFLIVQCINCTKVVYTALKTIQSDLMYLFKNGLIGNAGFKS